MKRQLKKLGNKQFAEDIKNFIKAPHEFYGKRVPEMKTLAKRLHEEYPLKDFYKVFNRLWKSGYQGEASLALHTLQLYKEEYDLNTWKFLKPKFKEITNWDKSDILGKEIIGHILLKYPKLTKEIIRLSKTKNLWIKRMMIHATVQLAKNKNIKPALLLIEGELYNKDENIQIANGIVLRDIGKMKSEEIKRFILKHIQMPLTTFTIATEHMKELRRVRKLKKLKGDKNKGFFWRLVNNGKRIQL
ncbi:DNA alkylation repair protein [Candidatus Pacearchaeota archaeon]|nr:DNA alkylation repair protein [Candidatus Pacearchaeota archaeon]